jgi:hypothetical protein
VLTLVTSSVLAATGTGAAGAQAADPAPATEGATTAEQPTTGEHQREEVRRQHAALAAELDVLMADMAAIEASLDALEGNVESVQARLEKASAAADRAAARARSAKAEEARIAGELRDLDARVRDLAVSAFIHGGARTGDADVLRRSPTGGELGRAGYLADLEVARQDTLARRLAQVRVQRERLREAAADAAAEAARVVEELAEQAAALEEARALQVEFQLQVEAEVERRVSEAAGLAELDRALSEAILEEQSILAARVAGITATASISRLPQQGPLPLVRVGSFVVHASIGNQVAAMLAAATADGIALGGGAYRDTARQVELRRSNCGPTDHDLYERPASTCRPPTARPGHSLHERGLALDLTSNGALITTRDDPAFRWLAEHAGRFGLRNLPSEPWHWSTTGG